MHPFRTSISVALAVLFCLINSTSFAQHREILDSIVQTLSKESIYKDKLDKAKYLRQLDTLNVQDFEGAVGPFVTQMFSDIGDQHGLFQMGWATFVGEQNESTKEKLELQKYAYNEHFAFRSAVISGKYGYVAIPSPQIPTKSFSAQEQAVKYISQMAQQIQDTLCAARSQSEGGLILDLRLSMGGNMPLLLNSIAPILGDGKIFDIVWGNGTESKYELIDGQLFEDNVALGKTKCKCNFDGVKVAVLLSPLTASASSQTAIALKGLPNVRFFGEDTDRQSSNITKTLMFKNGPIVTFAAGLVRDRLGVMYESSVSPDQIIKGGDNFESLKDDAKIKAALEWFVE